MKDAKINDMLDIFLRTLKVVSKRSDSTITSYNIAIKEFNKYLFEDDGKISDMTPLSGLDIMEQWFNKLEDEGLSVSSLNMRLTALSRFYKFLIGQLFDLKDVTLGIPKFSKEDDDIINLCDEQKKTHLTIEEVEKLFDYMDENDQKLTRYENLRNKVIVHLFCGCGVRIGELSQLTYKHVRIENEELFITRDISKRKKARRVDVPQFVIDIYKEYLALRSTHENDSEFLFISRKNNQMSKNAIRDMVKKVTINSVGFYMNPHGLRHTYGTLQFAAGQDPMYVSHQMGHANLGITTGLYVHQSTNTVNRANSNPMYKGR